MEFPSLSEDDSGPAIALDDDEIKNLLKLAKLSKRDIFFDLGSGFGEIVLTAIKKTKVKSAHGIEYDLKRFLLCIEFMRDELSKNQLKRIEFWRALYQDFDFSDGTVVYNGIYDYGSNDEIEMYENIYRKRKKPFKIIKRDLPLFPYKPIDQHRDEKGSWFFLMKTPLNKYKLRNKDKWAQYVLGKSDVTIKDVYQYHYKKLEERFKDEGTSKMHAQTLARKSLHEFQNLVKKQSL